MCIISLMQELREIELGKWENNHIVGFKLKIMSNGAVTHRYMTLKELFDEQTLIHIETELGKRVRTDNPVLLLKYFRKETGASVNAFVYIAKIGEQYEIKDVKDNNEIIHALLELSKE